MKVAIIHDWLTGMRGGEKCLEVFCELFPDATIFTLLHKKGSVSSKIENMRIKTSFIQHMPFAASIYRSYLPLFPFAIERFDLSGYDLVLSSSHCVAKGVRVGPNTLHICYCFTPMRYAWVFFDEYFRDVNFIKRALIQRVIKKLKKWDKRSNEGVDFFVAISDNVKKRIEIFYNKNADVIYPPVNVDAFDVSGQRDDFYLIVSALVPYKRIDVAIEAFNELGKKLIIIGSGNSRDALLKIAEPNIEFLGHCSDEDIAHYYATCRALIFPGEEDFGIVPVEAQACGKPVICFASGGALETVVPINPQNDVELPKQPTGVFFYQQTSRSLKEAVKFFESVETGFNPYEIRTHAGQFRRDIFKKRINDYITGKIKQKAYEKTI